MTDVKSNNRANAARWYWRYEGGRCGPVTWDTLQALAQDGKLRPSDLVCHVGTENWIRADEACADFEPLAEVATPTPAVACPQTAGLLSRDGGPDGPRVVASPSPSHREDCTGPAVAALALGAIGLFGLGLLMGGLAIVGGLGARRRLACAGDRRGAWIAGLAVAVGLADVLLVLTGLAAHAAGVPSPVPVYGR